MEHSLEKKLGESINVNELANAPYPIYNRLRASEPISWIAPLNMYWVTRHKDVVHILMDNTNFVVGTPESLIFDIFGENVLTLDGAEHIRLRMALRSTFAANYVRDVLEPTIKKRVNQLIDGFDFTARRVELRASFASRLPVLVMLDLFGLPDKEEATLRPWYNSFEAALGNFERNEDISVLAKKNAQSFHILIQEYIDKFRHTPQPGSLISDLVHSPEKISISDEEIRKNALIVLFGGISTVEALILDAIYALSKHPDALLAVKQDTALLPQALEEVSRWLSPVQSATRHVKNNVTVSGVEFVAGDSVNCILAAANRDPEVFSSPDSFDINRSDVKRHIAFARGLHTCPGIHLARAEARIALEQLFDRLPGCRMDPKETALPQGYEFHQPHSLAFIWD